MNTTLKLLVAALAAIGIQSAALAAPGDHPAVNRALAHLKAQAQGNQANDDAYAMRDVIIDNDGSEHVRFERSYKGLRVIGGDVVVHSDARGNFRSASRTLRDALSTDLSARFDDAAAEQYAQTLFTGEQDGRARASLVIYARDVAPTLAYDVTVRGIGADGSPSHLHLILDADSLQLLDRYDDFMTGASTGTAKTLYSGTVGITTDSQTGGFAMRDPLRGNNYTNDVKNKRFGKGTTFTDADNVWGNFSNADRATAGADAHYGLALTWDFYKNMFGRNGIDGTGKTTYSKVHYGKNYANAGWDDNCFCMTYGDGDNRTIGPLVAIDIAGHEMSHGVTSRTAGLIYSGESGGLNEGTSDIFGSMVEYSANNTTSPPNYLMGERIYVVNAGVANPTTALRYMFKPSLDGRSPDCYSASVGNIDVHYSSGIANHFFYLLAEGAVSPTGFALTPNQLVCNGNTALTGAGRDAASRIWYRALTVYMTSSTKYAAARTATLNAAADLYGMGSAQYNKVAAAWSAVNVN